MRTMRSSPEFICVMLMIGLGSTGAFAQGYMVSETGAISLVEAISKMGHEPASFIEDSVPQMRARGRVQEGAVADLTIFDSENVTDNSTPKIGEDSLPSTGIPFVIVNGTVVVDDSKVQRVTSGVAMRHAVNE